MIYRLYKMKFLNHVHFGTGTLDDTEISFHADTLFSALCQEAVRHGCLEKLYQWTQNGDLTFSDAFPYMGKRLYLPKPQIRIENEDYAGNSTLKKRFKKIKYIPLDILETWLGGNYVPEEKSELEKLGKKSVKVSAAIRGKEDPELYQVRYYEFQEGNGLYFIAGAASEKNLEFLNELIDSLSYSGLGGKRSAGLGRFECRVSELPKGLAVRLEQSTKRYMLLSCALPADEELGKALEGADFQLTRRGGFVASETYAAQQMRKKNLYVFAAGSCFNDTFKGKVYDVADGGCHSVYRYARGMFMGVDL